VLALPEPGPLRIGPVDLPPDRPPARAIFSTWAMERRSGVLIAVVSFLSPAAHEALSRMPARGKRPQAFRNASAV
jgi:hypothetical protein